MTDKKNDDHINTLKNLQTLFVLETMMENLAGEDIVMAAQMILDTASIAAQSLDSVVGFMRANGAEPIILGSSFLDIGPAMETLNHNISILMEAVNGNTKENNDKESENKTSTKSKESRTKSRKGNKA